MGKYPIYAIVALVFIGIAKLLQVAAFDADQYNKNKKESFSKPEKEVAIPVKSEEDSSAFNPSDPESQVAEETPPPVLDRAESDSMKENQTPTDDSVDDSFESTQPVKSKSSTLSLSDLKNNYLAPKIANLPPGQLREDVVIRYYRHDQDGEKIYSLKELGYYIHEKEANETAGLGSNILYYGNYVAVEDIQIVAYTLIEMGLPIKSIEPTRYAWKSTSIEIGTDTLLLDKTTLTNADVKNFSK